MSHTSDFLNTIGKLGKTFSVHEKDPQYIVKNVTETIALARWRITVLESNVGSIKKKNENLPKVLNGPECSISNKTYDSIKLLEWGLKIVKSMMLVYLVLWH